MRIAWLGRTPLRRRRGLGHGLTAGPWLGWLLTLLLLMPVLLAIWTVPGFITQDGPAHLYNAVILADSFDPQSPYRPVYEVRWEPFPNWAGHLTLVGLLRIVSPWVADRLMMTATLLGFALALVLAALEGERRARGAGAFPPGRPALDKLPLAAGIHQLPAGIMSVPDHSWRLVERARPGGVRAAGRDHVPSLAELIFAILSAWG